MTDRTQGDFGRTLREARERRGITLRQISNATKIGMGALEALERNDISRLPGGIFSRGIVRSYAVEVGLDPDAAIQRFVAQFPPETALAGRPASLRTEDHEAVESDRRAATTFVRLIAFSIPIAVALIYFGASGRREFAPTPEPPQAPSEPALSQVPESSIGVAVNAATTSPVGTVSAGGAPDRLVITLSTLRESWVLATVDGEKVLERMMRPGERITFEARRDLVLTTGDASAVSLTLNGAEARPLGRDGQAVTRRFGLDNFKEYVAAP